MILSHFVVFTAGVAAGYSINADELSTYRDLHESRFSRFKRKASHIGLGVFILGSIIMVSKLASAGTSSSSKTVAA